MSIEDLIAKARTCLDCGKVHEWRRYGLPPQGGTWADPFDGHAYRPACKAAADWLEGLLSEESH
jgi:hypothetical protein